MSKRYAIYFAPKESSQLSHFGEIILARTAICAREADASSSFTDQARWKTITKKPAHYGFHATLKAPFELRDNVTFDQLLLAVEKFASTQKPITLETLAPRHRSSFMALTLSEQQKELKKFAFSCVTEFENFRRPLTEADIKRRQLRTLTPQQDALLLKYGYPYIADEFSFHMTLSDTMESSDQDYQEWVQDQYTRCVTETPVLDQLAIFAQTTRETAFIQLAAFPLVATD
ncbi:MAG: DUF1045 domain-containing protein [Granulosicoccus sp.]